MQLRPALLLCASFVLPLAAAEEIQDGQFVAASHNHSVPGYVENMRWAADLIKKLGTAAKQAVGGYEPNRSILKPEAEAVILKELGALADRVVDDVFESFSKHPKDMQKRETEEKARLQSASTDKP